MTLADGLVEGTLVWIRAVQALLGKTAEQIRDQADVILLSQDLWRMQKHFQSETYGIPVVSVHGLAQPQSESALEAKDIGLRDRGRWDADRYKRSRNAKVTPADAVFP